jgi:hypothetical protein
LKRWNIKPFKHLYTILDFKFDAAPLLTHQNNAQPPECQHLFGLHTIFTQPAVSAEKRRQPLRRLRLPQNRRKVGGSTLPLVPDERRPMAHASTKQAAECQTEPRFFTFSSSGLHI